MEKEKNQIGKLALSIAESSEKTGLSKSYLRLEIKRRHLPARKIGRRVLILADDLRNYLESAAAV